MRYLVVIDKDPHQSYEMMGNIEEIVAHNIGSSCIQGDGFEQCEINADAIEQLEEEVLQLRSCIGRLCNLLVSKGVVGAKALLEEIPSTSVEIVRHLNE